MVDNAAFDSADAFLRDYHRAYPGITARALGWGRTDDDRSSYQVLAHSIDTARAPHVRVVDLGCGDGYLMELLAERGVLPGHMIGVDMSMDELALGRARMAARDLAASLLCARAQRLPVAAASVDVVLSHMAFMLMSDIDTVVAEIARVLRPGGVFATIVGGGPRLGDPFEILLDIMTATFRENAVAPPAIGDRRVYRDAGLAELFSFEAGFEELAIDDFYVHYRGSFEQIWHCLGSIYELHLLDDRERTRVRDRFAHDVAALIDADGTLLCTMAMRKVACTRRR